MLVYVMENRDIFTNQRRDLIFHIFREQGRIFHKEEVIIQDIEHGIPLVVQCKEDGVRGFQPRYAAQHFAGIIIEQVKTDIGAYLIGDIIRNLSVEQFYLLGIVDECPHGTVRDAQEELLRVLVNHQPLVMLDF